MQHKGPMRRADGTGWHYCSGSRDGGHPIGYCDGHAPHATEAEARECYGRYVREQTIRLDAGTCGWTSCNAGRTTGNPCPNPTQAWAAYGDDGYGITYLCPEHMTVESVIEAAQLSGAAGDAWFS